MQMLDQGNNTFYLLKKKFCLMSSQNIKIIVLPQFEVELFFGGPQKKMLSISGIKNFFYKYFLVLLQK